MWSFSYQTWGGLPNLHELIIQISIVEIFGGLDSTEIIFQQSSQ
jgi:hypothetical protein